MELPPRQRVAVVIGSAGVAVLLVAALVVHARDLPPADPPAVLAAPAPFLGVPRLAAETTTGEEVTAGLAGEDRTGPVVR